MRDFDGANSAELTVFTFSVPLPEHRACLWIGSEIIMFFLFVVEIYSCVLVYKLFNFVHCIRVIEVCRVLGGEDVGTRDEPIYDGSAREV